MLLFGADNQKAMRLQAIVPNKIVEKYKPDPLLDPAVQATGIVLSLKTVITSFVNDNKMVRLLVTNMLNDITIQLIARILVALKLWDMEYQQLEELVNSFIDSHTEDAFFLADKLKVSRFDELKLSEETYKKLSEKKLKFQ